MFDEHPLKPSDYPIAPLQHQEVPWQPNPDSLKKNPFFLFPLIFETGTALTGGGRATSSSTAAAKSAASTSAVLSWVEERRGLFGSPCCGDTGELLSADDIEAETSSAAAAATCMEEDAMVVQRRGLGRRACAGKEEREGGYLFGVKSRGVSNEGKSRGGGAFKEK